ncbi:hypothetical protein E4L81_34720 [Pseudomonas aeruginosa]|uniref:hypothetical protein n=1 Tax=Pseudomonas TaxID=286 RepID=UPI0009A3240B|nr:MULTISPECIES: hypothetical protein [Pseudomonas]WQN30336.1 hypothetical protein ULE26_22460 [Stutzerimonas stutzeri]HEN8704306.1 hypothetical protein [Pseudomonas putida]ELE1002264.1 hypothetical protein [Pseudomonas aeruginosa]MDB1107770.1 hypothetical protein [Pseudomonas extremaustralis]MDH4485067.1 hypothetical protein [Pseudomonas aeruginosa]
MNELTQEQIKAVYRSAIDPNARDSEGMDWWEAVGAEIRAVISAPTAKEASMVIAWWHHDWCTVADTPLKAAQRIRSSARKSGLYDAKNLEVNAG